MPSVTYTNAREIPASVVNGSGSYTIPVGFYAIVSAQVQAGETFAIGGTTVLSSVDTTWSVIASENNLYRLPGAAQASPTSSLAAGALASATAGFIGAPAGSAAILVYRNETARTRTSSEGSYRLPAGTTINGGRYCVQLFTL